MIHDLWGGFKDWWGVLDSNLLMDSVLSMPLHSRNIWQASKLLWIGTPLCSGNALRRLCPLLHKQNQPTMNKKRSSLADSAYAPGSNRVSSRSGNIAKTCSTKQQSAHKHHQKKSQVQDFFWWQLMDWLLGAWFHTLLLIQHINLLHIRQITHLHDEIIGICSSY